MSQNEHIEWGDTKALAKAMGVKHQSVHHSYCTKGHYFGLKPVKMPNRLLRWNLSEAKKKLGIDAVETKPSNSVQISKKEAAGAELQEKKHASNIPSTGKIENVRLRDQFASDALPACIKQAFEEGEETHGVDEILEIAAAWAYSVADAMLLERNK